MRRALLVAAVAALAMTAAPAAADDLVRDTVVAADSGSGEPEVEVNPGDPSNIVVGRNDAGVAVSHDGGLTFAQVKLPNPGDHVLTALRDGTFVYSALDGAVRVSHDGGSTWAVVGNWVGKVSEQTHELSDTGPVPIVGREVGCSAPEPEGPGGDLGKGPGPQVIGCDRPWLVADAQTGTLYVSFVAHDEAGGGEGATPWELSSLACRTTILTNPAFTCGRQYVAASSDQGRTWSRFLPLDGPDQPSGPTGGFSSGPVASGGVLAAAYVAASAPHASCSPCVVFETSRDQGVTWRRRLVPLTVRKPDPAELEQTFLFSPYLAGDPAHPGRYAVMTPSPDGRTLQVAVTQDGGDHFAAPVALAEDATGTRVLPWIAFGPTGALGAMWRTVADDGSYAAWAAVSPAGDGRFAPPVRLSSASSPGPATALAGDDASDVTMGATDLHAGWGDRRGGSLGIHLGRYEWSRDPAVAAQGSAG